MQVSGGHLLPPVQKLVATIRFAIGKSVIESLIQLSNLRRPNGWRFWCSYFGNGCFRPEMCFDSELTHNFLIFTYFPKGFIQTEIGEILELDFGHIV